MKRGQEFSTIPQGGREWFDDFDNYASCALYIYLWSSFFLPVFLVFPWLHIAIPNHKPSSFSSTISIHKLPQSIDYSQHNHLLKHIQPFPANILT